LALATGQSFFEMFKMISGVNSLFQIAGIAPKDQPNSSISRALSDELHQLGYSRPANEVEMDFVKEGIGAPSSPLPNRTESRLDSSLLTTGGTHVRVNRTESDENTDFHMGLTCRQ
jgi:hypothetical protein